ncbi:ribosomal-protein-alanine N-acetyltransferase [Inhella inkyongensis]|uniref:Ribosomal-protein-alanine N-acetyltransferase n=1 Tax=Inhella inkyongensis TaxID=392593 RepID=A0A840RW35_9BURK|nr:GNAT family protein [Inhella inkyongensis]MBB5202887.1 ribosomal-protein-alanine N-acetyltransferase [Inhella inkyongensis]
MKLETERLRLLPPHPDLAQPLLDFALRNRAHFAPWDPPYPPGFFTLAHWQQGLPKQEAAFAEGSGYRWYVVRPEDPTRVIGKAELSGIGRGPHQSAFLGYAIDAAEQGQGLMHEALRAVVAAAFGPVINLHRLQAGHRVDNHPSARVLDRLGFREIGIARDYLYIDGAWRDHRLTELINAVFVAPVEWRVG